MLNTWLLNTWIIKSVYKWESYCSLLKLPMYMHIFSMFKVVLVLIIVML